MGKGYAKMDTEITMNMQGELFEVTSQYLAKQRYYLNSILDKSLLYGQAPCPRDLTQLHSFPATGNAA